MITAPRLGGQCDLQRLADDIGHARTIQILGISARTLKRWIDGTTPVPVHVCKALYWESNWGRSVVDCDHHNERQIWFTRIKMLERQNERLRDALQWFDGLVTGAANAPLYDDFSEPCRA